jgi:hypothetical protein
MGFCVEPALIKRTILEHFKGSVERWSSDRHPDKRSARSRQGDGEGAHPK